MAQVLYETRGRVALVTLNRPEALNAFTAAMRAELHEALQKAELDPGVRDVKQRPRRVHRIVIR